MNGEAFAFSTSFFWTDNLSVVNTDSSSIRRQMRQCLRPRGVLSTYLSFAHCGPFVFVSLYLVWLKWGVHKVRKKEVRKKCESPPPSTTPIFCFYVRLLSKDDYTPESLAYSFHRKKFSFSLIFLRVSSPKVATPEPPDLRKAGSKPPLKVTKNERVSIWTRPETPLVRFILLGIFGFF